jgi:5-methylcytosine-specific restriction protein A
MRKIILFWDSSNKKNFEDYPEKLKQISKNKKVIIRWNLTTNFRRVSIGDYVILWCKGKGAVAMGKIIKGPFKVKPSAEANYIHCELSVLLNHNTNYISIKDIKIADPSFTWKNYQQSGRQIEEKHFNLISKMLQKQSNRSFEEFSVIKSNEDELTFSEGAIIEKLANVYERNVEARKKCIEYYKAICSCCNLDFGKKYGIRGEGYIHVHHLLPLHKIKESYKVNPIKHLRPVCPNCHAIIHRGKETLKIEQVKKLLKRPK